MLTRLLGRCLEMSAWLVIARHSYLLVQVEQAPVENIFDDCPEPKPKDPVAGKSLAAQTSGSYLGDNRNNRPPQRGDNPPGCLAQRLQKVAKQGCRVASLVVPRAVYLLQVKVLFEATIPYLHQQRLAQVEELVFLVVCVGVCLTLEILCRRHACRGIERLAVLCHGLEIFLACLCGQQRNNLSGHGALCRAFDDRVCSSEANQAFVQYLIRRVGVLVGDFVLEDIRNVFATVLEDEFAATWVAIEEVGNIVDLCADGNVAGLVGIVRLHVGGGDGWESAAWHGVDRRHARVRL
jgi:hypothetical protein